MVRPRPIFIDWHAESFGNGAHDEWYRDVLRWGPLDHHTAESADAWWLANVGVGEGYHSYGMRHPATQAEVDEAYVAFWALACDLFRDQRLDERPEPEWVARPATRWESTDEGDGATTG